MLVLTRVPFEKMVTMLTNALIEAPRVDVGQWHAKNVKGKPDLVSQELVNVSLEVPCPSSVEELKEQIRPNLPWAEDHFQERVGGEPLNPPRSAEWWAHDQKIVDQHRTIEEDGIKKYSHTYPERYWPKTAGRFKKQEATGIRFAYGDLGDVVKQLLASPQTRQAYLPVWFPEDTGAVHKERVPCSLGYHFLQRGPTMQIQYNLRSCDFVRHFRDDVYLTLRLLQWMASKTGATPGLLVMHIVSLHIFIGDVQILKRREGR